MAQIKEMAGGQDVMDALSPDLPMLASQAAIELDCRIRGKDIGVRAVSRLASILQNCFESGGTQDPPDARSIIGIAHPMSISLLQQAFRNSDLPVTTIEDLAKRASQIAQELNTASSKNGSKKKKLENMRNFCSQLSLCASSFLQSFQETYRPQQIRS